MIYLKQTLFIATLIIFFISLLTVIGIFYIGLNDTTKPADVAIILGTAVKSDGSPTKRLAARLNKGIELYQKDLVHYLIVSSGRSKEGLNESYEMKKYLIAHQIPASKIIMDNSGKNTRSTAENAVALMQTYGLKRVIVVSQYFHLLRTEMTFRQCKIAPVYRTHANYYEWRDLYSIGREVAAIYYYLFYPAKCS